MPAAHSWAGALEFLWLRKSILKEKHPATLPAINTIKVRIINTIKVTHQKNKNKTKQKNTRLKKPREKQTMQIEHRKSS